MDITMEHLTTFFDHFDQARFRGIGGRFAGKCTYDTISDVT